MSPVSAGHSRLVYDALKACGVRMMSALPETWLVHLIRMAEDDPDARPPREGGGGRGHLRRRALGRRAGVPRTATVRSLDAFSVAFDDALAARALTTLVAKVEAVGPSKFVTDLALLENRFQFQRYLSRGIDSQPAC